MTPSNAASRPGSREAIAGRSENAPTLSIILVSVGTRNDLERAVSAVAPRSRALRAQVIVVRRSPEPTLDFSLSDAVRVEIIRAADDCGRGEMLAMAMRAAHGDIVAVRDDTAVTDAHWLSGYGRALEPRGDLPRPVVGSDGAQSGAGVPS